MSDQHAADRLSDHLDAVVTGGTTDASSVDASTRAAVARFFAADDAPPPPPGLADRLWADLLRQQHAGKNGHRPEDLVPRPERPLPPPLERLPAPPPRLVGSSPRRIVSLLATAALVILTLAGSLVAIRGSLPSSGQDERPASIPAIDGVAEMTTVAEALVTAWPAADPLLWATLRRDTLDPGAVQEAGVAGVTGNSLDLFVVESGEVTFDADGPVYLWRADDDPAAEPAALPAGSTTVLDPGDRLFVPVGTRSLRRNDATEPAVVFGFQMTQQEVLLHPAGVTGNRVEPDKILNAPPPAPATLGMYRLRLLPGARLSLLALPGLQMLHVENGTLDLIGARRLGDLAPESWKSVPAGQGMAHFETTTELANGNADPVTVLIVTIEPVS